MAALLKTHGRDFNAVFAQNDDMALGAIQAIEEAGLRPGKDIAIVSIDGLKEALQAIVAGKLNCCVECNPMFGPKVFDAAAKLAAGESVPRTVYNHDELFDATNAARNVNQRLY
jgi:simple sugar transport system substrate-binding protein